MQKYDLPNLLYESIQSLDGSTHIVDICKDFWSTHEAELRRSGDLFYTWQYDIRWAATELRKTGRMKKADRSPTSIWEITK